jgi:hypothetical protein
VNIYICLLLACAASTLCAGRANRICALVLIANFIANETYVRITGQYTPWLYFLATDTIALIALTFPFSGRIGAILAATYATQLVMHLSYGISTSGVAYTYWQALTAMAWLQLLILFVGSVSNGCGRLNSHLRRLRGRVPVDLAPHPSRIRSAPRGGGEA